HQPVQSVRPVTHHLRRGAVRPDWPGPRPLVCRALHPSRRLFRPRPGHVLFESPPAGVGGGGDEGVCITERPTPPLTPSCRLPPALFAGGSVACPRGFCGGCG